jgi:hypothetical protein
VTVKTLAAFRLVYCGTLASDNEPEEEDEVAYSVMVWLVEPGEYPQQEDEETRAGAAPETASGAHTGANMGYAIPRMVYGVYESQNDAESALKEISNNLQQNTPLRISAHSHRQFLIPADRVHYVVCEEVDRPKD